MAVARIASHAVPRDSRDDCLGDPANAAAIGEVKVCRTVDGNSGGRNQLRVCGRTSIPESRQTAISGKSVDRAADHSANPIVSKVGYVQIAENVKGDGVWEVQNCVCNRTIISRIVCGPVAG